MQVFKELGAADKAAKRLANSGMDRLYIVLDGKIEDIKVTEVALLTHSEKRNRHVAAANPRHRFAAPARGLWRVRCGNF